MIDPPRTRASWLLRSLLAPAAAGALLSSWLWHASSSRAPALGNPLPDGRVVYSRSAVLYVANADGSGETRFTFGSARDESPIVLPDGRVAFRRSVSAGRIFTVAPDGTGLSLFCEPRAGESIVDGPFLQGERVAFVESDGKRISVSPRDPSGTRMEIATSDRAAATQVARSLALTSVVDMKKDTGTLLCLSVYTSRVPILAKAPRGTFRRVRILDAAGALLREAAVEEDGSFMTEVPADRPLQLELVGSDGAVIKDPSGFWVRPNESRGCIGCHEDPDRAPENRLPDAVARAAADDGAQGGKR